MPDWVFRIANSPSKTLVAATAAYLVATFVHAWSEVVWWGPASWLVLAFGVGVIGFVKRRHMSRRLFALMTVAAILALARFDAALAARPDDGPAPTGIVEYRGTVIGDPAPGLQDVALEVGDVTYGTSVARIWNAPLRLDVPISVRVLPGDRIGWKCRLRAPFRAGEPWRCRVSEPPRLLGQDDGRLAARWRTDLKSRFRLHAGRLLPEPEASFLLGLLIGDTAGLPERLTQAFRDTGASHVLAVSGYNVTKVIEAALMLSALVAVRRRRAAIVAATVVLVFVAVVGQQAPAARAALMGCLGCWAIICGRRHRGIGALLLSAAALLAIDPLALRHEIGFRLSFAAVAGLRFLGPPFEKRLGRLPETFGLRRTAAETLAATVATLPIILVDFGRFAWSAPLVNLAILPFIPWAMACGALALALGALASPLGQPAAWLTTWLLRLVETVATNVAAVAPPWPVRLGVAGGVVAYGLVLALWYRLTRAPRKGGGRDPSIDYEIEPTS